MGNYIAHLKAEKFFLQKTIGLRGLADYIAMSYTPSEQDELIRHLNDPTKQTRIIIEVTDRETGSQPASEEK